MGLADRLDKVAQADRAHRNAGCELGRWIAQQPEEHRPLYRKFLDNTDVGHRTVEETLQAEGCPAGYSTVLRHRNGGCKCDEAGLR